jgi:hypothetical protein
MNVLALLELAVNLAVLCAGVCSRIVPDIVVVTLLSCLFWYSLVAGE